MVYDANGQVHLARQCYESALARKDSEPRWWHLLALSRARLGDVSGALDAFERVIALDGSYAPAHWRRGLLLLDRGDLDAAQSAFERATRVDANDAAGFLGMARVHLQRGENERAVEVLEGLLSRRPGDRYALQLLGTAYQRLGRSQEARVALAVGAGGEPAWSDPWTNDLSSLQRGFAAELKEAGRRFLTGDLTTAIRLLEGLRQQKPNDLTLLNHLGAVYVAAGRTKEGLEVLEAALTQDPDHFETHLSLANAYLQSGDPQAALSHAERSIAANPASAKAHEAKGLALWRMRQNDRALASFSEALRQDPRNPMPRVWMGMIEGERGRLSRALAHFERAIEQNPTLADAFLGMAMVKLEQGEIEDGEATLARAATLDPQNPRLPAVQARLDALRAGR